MKKSLFHLGLAIVLSACNTLSDLDEGGDNNNSPEPSPAVNDTVSITHLKLAASASCNELTGYIEDALVEYYTKYNDYSYRMLPMTGMLDDGIAESSATSPSSNAAQDSPSGVSKTNTQEAGVDELDWLKTDEAGNILIAQGQSLYIVQTYPPESLSQQSKIDLGFETTGLYIDEKNHRVIVFGQQYPQYYDPDVTEFTEPGSTDEVAPIEPDRIDGNMDQVTVVSTEPGMLDGIVAPDFPYYQPPQNKVAFIDVEDLANPVLTKTMAMDADYISSRMIENRVHMVTRKALELPLALTNSAEFNQLIQDYQLAKQAEEDPLRDALRLEIRAAIHQALVDYSIENLLPQVRFETATDGLPVSQSMLNCSDVLKPEVIINPPGLLTITSFKTDGDDMASTAIMNNAWQTYASTEALYVTQSNAGWFWDFDGTTPHTVIYKFDITEAQPQYVATGKVEGTTNHSFAYSEHNGFLRVATTERRFDLISNDNIYHSNVFVLEQQDHQLEIVGEVRGFAPNEDIYSVRFMGERGFVATFRQIDPLFTFDLSDPTAPQLMGELEIPGFSEYMHPLDENHLLTIGRSGNELGDMGRMDAVQLQIFDISDLSAPQLTAEFTLFADAKGSSWSPASYDHHAFTYHAPSQTLAIPVNFSNWHTGEMVAGMGLYSIDINSGIAEIGIIDHSDVYPPYDPVCYNHIGEPAPIDLDDPAVGYPVLPVEPTDLSHQEPDFSGDINEPLPPVMPINNEGTIIGDDDYIRCDEPWFGPSYNQPQRSVFVSHEEATYVYTLSNDILKVVDLEDVSTTLNTLILNEGDDMIPMPEPLPNQ